MFLSRRFSYYRRQDGRIRDTKTSSAEHEKSQAETYMLFGKKIIQLFIYFCTSDGAKANVLIHNAPNYPGTTGNNLAIRTPPRVT